jgi:hypothetical protein
VDVPQFGIAARVASISTMAHDCVPQGLGVFAVFFLFRQFAFRAVGVFKFRPQKMQRRPRNCDAP